MSKFKQMKNIFKIAFLSIMMLLITQGYSQAQSKHPIDAAKDKCYETHSDALGILECEINAYRDWSSEVERLYDLLYKNMDAKAKLILKEEHLTWLKMRDLKFSYLSKLFSNKGNEGLIFIQSSKTQFVRTRALELQELANYLRIK